MTCSLWTHLPSHNTYELIKEKPVDKQQEVTIRLHVNLQQDQRTHNLSITEEITVIIPEKGVHCELDNRDVVLQERGEWLEWISQNSPSYAAFHYVLLFPKGVLLNLGSGYEFVTSRHYQGQ